MDHTVVWADCLNTIRERVDKQSYQTWFAPIQPLSLKSNELTIQIPNRLFYEYLEEHYVEDLKVSLQSALGGAGRLQYRIAPARTASAPSFGTLQPSAPATAPTAHRARPPQQPYGSPGRTAANPFVIPGVTRPRIESRLLEHLRFDNFIEGDCNSLARNAAKAVADNPHNTAFNPLVIHGNVGLGKTHLLHAVGNYVQEKYPNKSVLYVNTDEFTNQLIASIGNGTTNDLVNWYQNIDVLLVDDIQHLTGRKKTQDVFFSLFNVLRQNNKAIVMTCDKPIVTLDIPERLRSRFQWGLSADLTVPALETRMAILASKATANQVELDPKVMEFMCFHIRNNIRQLEGALNNLVLHGNVSKNGIDMQLAQEVLKNFVSEINKEITPEIIQKTVAEYFDVDLDRLIGPTRIRQVVIARQISMFLLKEHTDKSLKAIGKMFGGRDHTTVIYSIKAVNNALQTDETIKQALEELEQKIRMGRGE